MAVVVNMDNELLLSMYNSLICIAWISFEYFNFQRFPIVPCAATLVNEIWCVDEHDYDVTMLMMKMIILLIKI